MKFLVDARLPRLLTDRLREAGHDALHTLDLPNGNRTTDREINRRSEREERVVVTKDDDFVNSLLVRGVPPKLLLVSTGNITNDALEAIFDTQLPAAVEALRTHDYLELGRTALIVHE
jgi:predicted nuclease of predicted toxin-antitoxin system